MSVETLADRRVHPATVPLRFLKEAPSTLLGLPAGYALLSDQGLGPILLFAALIAIVALVYHWLAWQRFRYGIGERELVIESGILSRTRRSIPFDRIQDVDIERGPLARLFGLARLRIETGGSGGDEGVLDSVSVNEAERLRSALRAARRPSLGTDQPSASPEAPVEILFAMSTGRVLALGLFNFSMVYLASIFALLQTFGRWLPFDIHDPGRWIGIVDDQLSGSLSAQAIIAVAMLALLLGLLSGVLRTLSREFGLRVTHESAGFRRQAGLFTRSDVLVPKARIQLALLETGPLRRRLGWYAVGFQTLRGSKLEDGGRHILAPFARSDEILRILAAQGDLALADPADLKIISSRHLARRLVSRIVLPLLIIIPLATIWHAGWLFLPLLALIAVHAFIERRFLKYGLSPDHLFVQEGIWRQRQWIVPRSRIQSLRLTQSWLQRRLDLASLAIDTAGAPLMGGVQIVDLRVGDVRALMDRLYPSAPSAGRS